MSYVLKRSLAKKWFDVIFALFVREIKIGFNDKLGIGWAVVQPVLFILVLSFLRGRLNGGETHGIPTFIFMAYGLIYIQLFLQTFMSTANAIQKNKPLFAFRQVQPISPVVASGLFELLVKIFVILALGVIVSLLDMELRMADPIAVIGILIGLWLFSMFAGLIFGLLRLFVPELRKLEMMMTRPLFFISGVFFSLKDVPQEFWYLLNWNPILHAIELSRYSAYSHYGQDGVSFYFLGFSILVFVFAALVLYQRLWKQAISQ